MKHTVTIGFVSLSIILTLSGCASSLLSTFAADQQPPAPDYTAEEYWSALPFRKDAPDIVTRNETWESDSQKLADVFYIYPTMYQEGATWNASLQNKKLNKRIDKLPVKLQAGAFSNSARVYAPRYRQAIIKSFHDTTGAGDKALDFAYQDVKIAFEYYMANYNNNRPIIIASHSQGTHHARRLIKEYFDTEKQKQQLVCAYIVGFAIYPDQYEALTLCEQPEETQCYVTWSSFKAGYEYPDTANDFLTGYATVNPITWTTSLDTATTGGSVLLNPSKRKRYNSTAYIHGNYLWVDTELIFMKNRNTLHVVDYNLFWDDVRKNAALRINEYLKQE